MEKENEWKRIQELAKQGHTVEVRYKPTTDEFLVFTVKKNKVQLITDD